MKIEMKWEKNKITLTLSGELTIHHAEELKKAFLKAFDNSSMVEVGIEEVKDVDLSFAQTFLSAARTGDEMKIEFGFSKDRLPEAVCELCSRAGVDLDSGRWTLDCILGGGLR